jgi:hypothetical protein
VDNKVDNGAPKPRHAAAAEAATLARTGAFAEAAALTQAAQALLEPSEANVAPVMTLVGSGRASRWIHGGDVLMPALALEDQRSLARGAVSPSFAARRVLPAVARPPAACIVRAPFAKVPFGLRSPRALACVGACTPSGSSSTGAVSTRRRASAPVPWAVRSIRPTPPPRMRLQDVRAQGERYSGRYARAHAGTAALRHDRGLRPFWSRSVVDSPRRGRRMCPRGCRRAHRGLRSSAVRHLPLQEAAQGGAAPLGMRQLSPVAFQATARCTRRDRRSRKWRPDGLGALG